MRENISGGALTEVSLLVLLALHEERHGYGIRQWVMDATQGRVELGMGTLYGAIKHLADKGWIEETSRVGRRVNYFITVEGRREVEEEKTRLQTLTALIDEVRREP